MPYQAGKYDIIVVGGGHAGVEASLAAARLGMRTLLLSLSVDHVGFMPCNPSIGGPAKGNLVSEIDALGGQMGLNIDSSLIQIRMLNTSKGPAVRALRAQADKREYQQNMLFTVENQENLWLKQAIVEEVLVDDNHITGVRTSNGAIYNGKAVILTTGTYLKSRIIIGDLMYHGGPNGQPTAMNLTENLQKLGLETFRFKTGTPARVDKRSINFDKMEIQPGDKGLHFSFMTNPETMDRPSIPCYLSYTNPETHKLIRDNIHLAPMYSGKIEGIGARYCPSIEDKVVRFADRDAHQLFLEPEGLNNNEYYVQGMSTSLPQEIQEAFLRTIRGLEHVEVMRPAYAIEYDGVVPTQLSLTLEYKSIKGLYGAGQINGTSGYEEAASQGLLAGINASLKLKGEEPLILKRSDAYMGVLVDDLVTKGTNEPYRLFTSRAEYRLLLRQDNAALRLTEMGRRVGLVTDDRWDLYNSKLSEMNQARSWLVSTRYTPTNQKMADYLQSKGSKQLVDGINAYNLIKRPEIAMDDILAMEGKINDWSVDIRNQVELETKYEGYLKKQIEQVKKFNKLDNKLIPADVNYKNIKGLRIEATQKLDKIQPKSVGQASRISGVSPADIGVLLVYLEQRHRKGE